MSPSEATPNAGNVAVYASAATDHMRKEMAAPTATPAGSS